MQNLEIRRGRLDPRALVSYGKRDNARRGRIDPRENRRAKIDVEIYRLLVIESNLVTIAALSIPGRRFGLASTVSIAAAVRLTEHEVLLTRDATAAEQRRDQQKRKQ